MEKKTILEILQAAKADGDEWAQAAIEAHKNNRPKYVSKSQAIMFGFDWSKTPQGAAFWDAVFDEEFEKEYKQKSKK